MIPNLVPRQLPRSGSRAKFSLCSSVRCSSPRCVVAPVFAAPDRCVGAARVPPTDLRRAFPVRSTILLARHHIVAPALGLPDGAGASVCGAARMRGPIARDAIAHVTSLSIATVNRQVTSLLDAGLLRERPDLAVSGATGPPRVPVEINHEPYLTLGLHIGARTTSIAATDLFGRTLDVVETPTPQTGHAAALDALAGSVRRYLSRWHRRRPLWVGVAMGGVVEPATGTVDHPRLGWTGAPVGSVFAETMGLPVSVAVHVDAVGGAGLLLGVTRLVPANGRSLPSALRASGSSLPSTLRPSGSSLPSALRASGSSLSSALRASGSSLPNRPSICVTFTTLQAGSCPTNSPDHLDQRAGRHQNDIEADNPSRVLA